MCSAVEDLEYTDEPGRILLTPGKSDSAVEDTVEAQHTKYITLGGQVERRANKQARVRNDVR